MGAFTQFAFWKTFFTPNRYSHEEILDQTGKVAIVTGANSGLGYATAVALAGQGAHVFFACRSKSKALAAIERARKEIKELYPQLNQEPKLEFMELDLNDLNNTYQTAKEFMSRGLPLHILICNAAIMGEFALSADRIEQSFAVNHMGHYVFTMALLDRMKESQPSKIIIVSSLGHESTPPGGIDFETLNDGPADIGRRYGRSKLANVLFGKALARRLAQENVFVNITHPGCIAREDDQNQEPGQGLLQGIVKVIDGFFDFPARTCALTPLYLATSPEIESKDIRGRYFIPIANEIQPSAYANDEALQEKLWTFSESLAQEKVRTWK
ncbi:hypothetical protein BGZ83_002476 [Gryganskiella cystojenkinii]|nr:hypothetical protein BGZ83_002476 [Gryganskiella cystojenkinii]